MEKEVTILRNRFNGESICLTDSIDPKIVNDFIEYKGYLDSEYFTKQNIKKMDSFDLRMFGDTKLLEHFKNDIPEVKRPAVLMHSNHIDLLANNDYEMDPTQKLREIKFCYVDEKEVEKINSLSFHDHIMKNLDFNWDFNKKRLDYLETSFSKELSKDEGGVVEILKIESTCFKRKYDQDIQYHYSDHVFKFFRIYPSLEYMNNCFGSIKECVEFYKDYFQSIKNGDYGYLDLAKCKAKEIEEELLKDEHWKTPEGYEEEDQ